MTGENSLRILYVDLEAEKIRLEMREDLLQYIGGCGVGAKLLEENMKPDLPPLDPAQPIVFALGPLSYIFPVMTKVAAVFISPLTGEYGESYAGGRLAMAMFLSGFSAIVITGKAKKPTYISISSHDVSFKDARTLWGSDKGIGRVIRAEARKSGGKRSIMRIGTGGENQVSYACVTVDTYRHFGRLGLGAVFGSKFLKAISIVGDLSMPVQDFNSYFKVYRELYKRCTESDLMKKYHDIGTPINVVPLNEAGALPTRNMLQNRFEHADKVSGEVFANEYLIRKLTCVGCPVGCIHIAQLIQEFADHGYEREALAIGYDFELIYALGIFLGLKDPKDILKLIEEVEKVCLDSMSTGVVLGWATEAFQEGIISTKETIVPLSFGEVDGYLQAVKYIAAGQNEFYKHVGKGTRHVSNVYGGRDFAMQVGGNEMAGYHTGYGSLVGAAVGSRHSHLCNGGYAVDQSLKDININTDEFAETLLKEETERCVLNSLVMCLFARKIYDRDIILEALASVGFEMTDVELTNAAKRIYAVKLRVKKALGFNLKDIRLPKRFFETPSIHGNLDESTAYEIISKYVEKLTEFEQVT